MNRVALRGRVRDVNRVGLAAFCLLAGAVIFHVFVLRPLEARRDALEELLARGNATASRSSLAQTADRLAGLYAFLETRQEPAELLAKINAAGTTAGVELRAAEYRL